MERAQALPPEQPAPPIPQHSKRRSKSALLHAQSPDRRREIHRRNGEGKMKSPLIRCPCVGCVVDAGCSYICDDMVEFISFFIENKSREFIRMYISSEKIRELLLNLNIYHHKVASVIVSRHWSRPGLLLFRFGGTGDLTKDLYEKFRHLRFSRKEFR